MGPTWILSSLGGPHVGPMNLAIRVVAVAAQHSPEALEAVVVTYSISRIQQAPEPRLNIKTVLSTYGDFHVKDKTAAMTSYL